MEHKTTGVGSPALLSMAGNGSPEREDLGPRRKRGRSGALAQGQESGLTIAGVAWRASGAGQALVVMARGRGAGQMRASFATLTVFHGGQTFPVTAPVTIIAGEDDASSPRQTLRFVFRLPASAPGWAIERMVLRWRGTEVELPPPVQPPEEAAATDSELFRPAEAVGDEGEADVAGGEAEPVVEVEPVGEMVSEPVAEPELADAPLPDPPRRAPASPEPVPDRYRADIAASESTLASLREEIITAKLDLAQLHAEIAQARLQYEEASMAREYAQMERERTQQWLIDVTDDLEDVERQLADCRRELDLVTRELAARRAALEQEPPSPETQPATGRGRGAQRDLDAALSRLRSKIDQVLSQPRPVWTDEDPPEAVSEAVAGEPAVEEPAIEEPRVEEPAMEAPPIEEPRVEEPAMEAPPIEEPPAETPPIEEPSVEEPPMGPVATEEPPAEKPTIEARQPAPAQTAEDAPPDSATEPEQSNVRTAAALPGRIDREEGESSWFATALRRLAEDEPEAAGHLLVSVLPAQAIATPRSFHYDLVVRDDAVYAVDSHPLDTRVQQIVEPRPMDQTDAWIMATLEQLGDLIVQGKSGFLRLFNRHGVKVKGQRARLDDLLALATAPFRLRDLCAVGAPIEPQLLLEMIVSSIDPGWTDERPLSIRFDPREEGMRVCSVRIQDGSPLVLGPEATAAADFGETTTIAEGSARSLMRLLAGLPSPEGDQANVTGPPQAVEVLQGWVRRLELSSL